MIKRIEATARDALSQTAPGWQLISGRDALQRDFKFSNFSEAWAFMSRIALLAEKHDHHPEWSNVYNRVSILLTTHDAGGLSERDVRFAQAVNDIAS